MVLGNPNTKCPHGVFKAGEETAKYCSFCNPGMQLAAISRASAAVLSAMNGVSGGVGPEVEHEEEVLDCVAFIQRGEGSRLASLR